MCYLLRSWPSLDTRRYLSYNELTTLPEGIFGGLTALETLSGVPKTTSSPRCLCVLVGWPRFVDHHVRQALIPSSCVLFAPWPSVDTRRSLSYNNLTTLPEGIFGGCLCVLVGWPRFVDHHVRQALIPSSCVLFAPWPSVDTRRSLSYNNLTTLPEGIFGGLTALEKLF
ncbi:unnamed protein product [Ectocarpus sp. CCAP 1310/34]|nr:unnamed protein product [Ectocarpus sp. CCAP 1310/34]